MQQFNYKGFLSYEGSDYADFSQHYSFSADDYDDDDKESAKAASQGVFGVSWSTLDSEIIAQTITGLISRAMSYRKQPQNSERNAIESALRIVNVAIFFKVAPDERKQFFYQSDRVTQAIAEE